MHGEAAVDTGIAVLLGAVLTLPFFWAAGIEVIGGRRVAEVELAPVRGAVAPAELQRRLHALPRVEDASCVGAVATAAGAAEANAAHADADATGASATAAARDVECTIVFRGTRAPPVRRVVAEAGYMVRAATTSLPPREMQRLSRPDNLAGLLAGTQLALVLVALLRRRSTPAPPPVPWRSAVPIGVAGGAAAWLAGLAGAALVTLAGGTVSPSTFLTALDIAGPATFVVVLLGAVVAAPLAEELFFRRHLLERFRRAGVRGGVATSAVLFGVAHLDPLAVVPLTLVGVVFGATYLRGGGYRGAVVAHAIYNAAGFVLHVSSP